MWRNGGRLKVEKGELYVGKEGYARERGRRVGYREAKGGQNGGKEG